MSIPDLFYMKKRLYCQIIYINKINNKSSRYKTSMETKNNDELLECIYIWVLKFNI